MTATFSNCLAVSATFHDFDEMALFPSAWAQEYQRLGYGPFRGRLSMLQTPQLQLTAAARSPGIDIQGAIPAYTLTLGVPLNPQSPIYFHGGRLTEGQVGALRYGEEIDLHVPRGAELLVLAVDQSLIQRQALALWGSPLEEHRVNERLLFRDAASGLTHKF